MRTLLLSTAILGATSIPAFAQDQSIFREAPDALEIRASDFMGMRVYASEAPVEGEEFEGAQEGWEDVGEINDIVMDRDGSVQAVLVDIGGFLGMGERTVAVSMDALQLVSDSATAEDVSDFFLVMNANREALEAAPEYVTTQGEGMTAEQAATQTDEAIEDGGEEAAATTGAAVESTEEADDNATVTIVNGAEEGEEAGEEVADETAEAAEGVENAAEETGEEIADAGEEVADEASDAGEEIAEEADQVDMTDTEEDQAEATDDSADAQEEANEEAGQATDEAADESADQAEATAETTETEGEMAAEETAEAAARTPVAREGFVAAGVEDFTADRLQGAAVFDTNDERVGEVGEILLSEDGQVSNLVIDVGGFLGLGEKPVALELSTLDILRQDGGEEIRVYVSQTEEELEAMERHEAQ